MTNRRRLRLLRYLMAAQCRGEATLVARFGSNVHALLTQLHLADHIEPDMGERRRWRLTTSGRSVARRELGMNRTSKAA